MHKSKHFVFCDVFQWLGDGKALSQQKERANVIASQPSVGESPSSIRASMNGARSAPVSGARTRRPSVP
jgi:hypothetical protein